MVFMIKVFLLRFLMKIPGKRVGKINLVGIPGSMPKFEEKKGILFEVST